MDKVKNILVVAASVIAAAKVVVDGVEKLKNDAKQIRKDGYSDPVANV